LKLLGKDFSPRELLDEVNARLEARGLTSTRSQTPLRAEQQLRVDPLSFQLDTLTSLADATQGVPIETHRSGMSGQAVVLSKKLFRRLGQIFINEAFARQTRFNETVVDSYAQLAAEVLRLKKRVLALETQLATSKLKSPAKKMRIKKISRE
jgi:DNA-binding response OmpR family regulator